jgi:hypothetical protein
MERRDVVTLAGLGHPPADIVLLRLVLGHCLSLIRAAAPRTTARDVGMTRRLLMKDRCASRRPLAILTGVAWAQPIRRGAPASVGRAFRNLGSGTAAQPRDVGKTGRQTVPHVGPQMSLQSIGTELTFGTTRPQPTNRAADHQSADQLGNDLGLSCEDENSATSLGDDLTTYSP